MYDIAQSGGNALSVDVVTRRAKCINELNNVVFPESDHDLIDLLP